MRMPVRAAVAALLVMTLLAGCGTHSTPVAKVGDRTLTVDDFMRAARANASAVMGRPEEAKATLLRSLVERELFLVAAHVHGSDSLASAKQFAATTERKLLMQAFYASISPPDLAASEGEARAMYEWRREQVDVHLIYCLDETVIRMAMQHLAAGERFADVAARFNEPNVLPAGGSIGMRSPGDLFEPLDTAMRTQRVGEVGGPWQTAQGWFLLKLTSRIPAPLPPFDQARSGLMEMLRRRKQSQAIARTLVAIEQANHLQITNDGPALVFRFLAPARVADAPHWMPDAAERKLPLATWDGGAYTMADAMDALLNSSETRGPDAGSIGSVRSWIQGQAVAQLALTEARRRHLDQEDAVAGKLHDELTNHVAEGEVLQAVASVPAPDPAAVLALWESMKQQYPQLKGERLLWLASADTARINSVARRGEPGVSLRDAAQAADPSLVVHEENLAFPPTQSPWKELQGELSQLAAGAWSQPLNLGTEWRLVQVLERHMEPIPWDQLTPPQQTQITHSLSDRARQARFEAYKDSLWHAINPVMMPENLRHVPWPPPVTVAVGS